MTYTPASLKRLRRAHRLTQQQLADQLGVSRQTVKNWEGGRRGVARRYHAQLAELGPTTAKPTARANSRPRYADLAPGDWAAASKYGWCELKHDGEYCEIRGGPDGYTITNRRGRTVATSPEPLPVCHLLCEHIVGTEWARASGLFGSFVAWAALSAKGVHLSRVHLVAQAGGVAAASGLPVTWSERIPMTAADPAWTRHVIDGNWEGLIFRTAGGRFARMKRRVTMDYVCTGSNGDSVIGALYNKRGQLIDKVSVPCPDEPRPGQVFEASGLAVTERGSLRNPRWERWRDDKPAQECCR